MSINESAMFDSAEDFIAYLRDTLIPDLIESERHEMARDFQEAIYWLRLSTMASPRLAAVPAPGDQPHERHASGLDHLNPGSAPSGPVSPTRASRMTLRLPGFRLDDEDGNAYHIIGRFRQAARRAGWHRDEIDDVVNTAKNGDYDHLLLVFGEYTDA